MPEPHWAAEPVSIMLTRAHPGELTADQLAEELDLDTDDIRAGLEELRATGRLNEEGEHFAINLPGDAAGRKPEPARTDEEDPGDGDLAAEEERPPRAEPPAPVLPAPGAGPSYRASYGLQIAFAGARGEKRDETARKDAAALEEKIADALAEGLGVGVSVELTDLEAFDSPRPAPLDPDAE
jgi:hypothetical protein